jgi:sugar-specific transcriptional regulator TrmB
MKWTKENLALFGFTKEEGEIFSILEDTLSLQEISRQLPIPRTTIAYTLKNLLKRGFVCKVPDGKRFKYTSLSLEQLQERIEKVMSVNRR